MHRSIRHLLKLATTLFFGLHLAVLSSAGHAGIIQVGAEYEVSYSMAFSAGTPTGGPIENVMIFEWDDRGNRSVDAPFSIAPTGTTVLRHRIAFAPTSALIMGYLEAGPETSDKRVLYTIFDSGYSNYLTSELLGVKFSEIFSQGERATYTLIEQANSADPTTSETALRD